MNITTIVYIDNINMSIYISSHHYDNNCNDLIISLNLFVYLFIYLFTFIIYFIYLFIYFLFIYLLLSFIFS